MSTSIKAEVLAVCWSGGFRCVLTQWQGGKTSAMILEKPSIWERKHGHFQTIRSSSLYSEEDYSQVEDIQNRHQEWTSQPIHPKIRACNAQRNGRTSPQAQLTCSMIKFTTVHLQKYGKYGMFGKLARRKPLASFI